MLRAIRDKVNHLSRRAVQNITGATIGLTTALASIQRAGCAGNCRTCQSCSVAGIMLITAPFILKLQGREKRLFLGIALLILIGVGLVAIITS